MQNLSYENDVYLHKNKNRFYIYGFAPSLALKQSIGATRKMVSISSHWPKPIGPLMKFTQRSIPYCFDTTHVHQIASLFNF